MEKKIIVVTGASDGIGKETAKTLASQGHIMIIHGRNEEKTRAAYREIIEKTGNRQITMYVADFLSLKEVRKFADQVKQSHPRIDILINNAGAQFTDNRETTSEGHEKTVAINLLAPTLLTTLLLNSLRASPSARVITVSSDSHRMSGPPDLDDIELTKKYSMARAYSLSKLYIIWVMQHFSKAALESGIHNITFNVVHPSSTQSNLGREAIKSLKWKIIYYLWKPMMVSLQKAASSSIYAAIAPELEGVSGKYFGPNGEEAPSLKYYSPENELKVWNYTQDTIKSFFSMDGFMHHA